MIYTLSIIFITSDCCYASGSGDVSNVLTAIQYSAYLPNIIYIYTVKDLNLKIHVHYLSCSKV